MFLIWEKTNCLNTMLSPGCPYTFRKYGPLLYSYIVLLIGGDISAGWVMAALATVVITIITLSGNAVVMVALCRAKKVPAHYPLASLVAADLLLGLSVLPIAAARELFVFHLPWAVCACWSTLDVLCCTASIISICVLGWERWSGITAPLARARRLRLAKITSALVWPISTVIALPTALIPSPRHYQAGELAKACTVNTNVGYVFSSVTFSFYVPASIMIFLYTRILIALAVPPPIRAHRGRSPHQATNVQVNNNAQCGTPPPRRGVQKTIQIVTPNSQNLAPPSDAPEAANVPSPLKKSNSPGGILPRQRRATKTIVTLMSLFLFCWTPFFIMLPTDSLCSCLRDTTWLWCTWLGYANSALNPMVYAVGSPSVRRALHSSFTLTSTSSCVTDVALTPCVRRP